MAEKHSLRISWIGLGAMGAPMAAAAARAGHRVTGYARRPGEQDDLRDAGGTVTADLIASVADAELVCITLFSEKQVRAVLVDAGALAMLPEGAIVAVHSTVSPGFIRELAGLRRDVAVLDAGFSGGPADAAAGTLTLMVGGDEAALDRAGPAFSTYADHIAHLGPLGSGMTLKILNNLMFAANVAIARDVLRLAEANGLALDAAIATLSRGSAGSTALALIGRGGDPAATITAIRPYLEKDVAIARRDSAGMDLGTLDAATRSFGATSNDCG